ncbi:MAG: hypothetical protein IPL98_11210 [Saprospiraceae bacterium]|nr:hypothetical protein [Saprospiraceae bacterium]
MRIFIISYLFLSSYSLLGSWQVQLTSLPACKASNNGAIFISILDPISPYDIPPVGFDYLPPFEVSIENIVTGEMSYTIMLFYRMTIHNMRSGKYKITIYFDKTCFVEGEVVVDELVNTLQVEEDIQDFTCNKKASIGLIPSGGQGPYAVTWNNNSNQMKINNLDPGEYCYTLTDDIGCENISCVDINPKSCEARHNYSVKNYESSSDRGIFQI